MTKDDALCSTREAAQLLGVSLRTIQLWVESGVLRAWKTAGGHRRIPRTEVEKLLEDRRLSLADEIPQPSGDMTVLVVEDDVDLLKLYRMNMLGWDLPIKLVTATNGFEGLVRIGDVKPDLLISDLNMPGMDGFRMIRTLHAHEDFKDMTIIAVTALSLNDIQDRGGLPEGVKIFTKPVPFSQLERLVKEKLAARQAA